LYAKNRKYAIKTYKTSMMDTRFQNISNNRHTIFTLDQREAKNT